MPTNSIARLEHQLALAQQITHIGSWEWDLASGSVTWSDELYRIYGLEPQSHEITLEFFLSRVLEEDRARIQSEVGAALERGGRFQWPERIVRPDGTIRELDTVGEVLVDEAGKTKGLLGTCRDVTEERARDEKIRLYAAIVHNVQIGLTVWYASSSASANATLDGDSLRLLAANPEAEKIGGRSLASSIGKTFREVASYAVGGQVETLLLRVARDRGVHEAVIEGSRDANNPTRVLAVRGFPLERQQVALALEDITEQVIERKLQLAEHRVLERIAAGAPLNESLGALIDAVEEHVPPVIGSILFLDDDGKHVRHGVAAHLPEAFVHAIDGRPIGPQAGSCGTAAFLKRPVFVSDIETDPRWDEYRALAREHGLRACFSSPVLSSDDRVLGTFAFYYRTPHEPTARELEAIARASRLAGIAIERAELEGQLRELSAHVESVREEERAGIAREIHDELGQALTAMKLDIAWILRRATSESITLTKMGLVEKLRAMSAFTDDVIHTVRRISAELRPGVLDDLGLVAAIEWQAGEFEERTGTTCVVRCNVSDAPVDKRVSTAVFRIFQEALTNVTRHASAKVVEVKVDMIDGEIVLDVTDDGVGITHEAARSPKSLGLLGIRERARGLGGSVTVEAILPRGTRVALRVPSAPPPRGAS